MKRIILSTLLLASIGLHAETYTVDVKQRYQTNEGWGVSLCWWANMCGRWNDERVSELVDWLVSPEGLNYNIFRYNIGGGDDPNNGHCLPHHMGKGKGLRAEMEGFNFPLEAPEVLGYEFNRSESFQLPVVVEGSKLTQEVRNMLSKARRDETIYLEHVRVRLPDQRIVTLKAEFPLK